MNKISVLMSAFNAEDYIEEAMSLGKPVIGTEIAGIQEQIDNNKTGFVVNPKDVGDLAEAIKKMMNVNKLKEFSIKAKEKYSQNYTVDVSLKKYINIYNK